MYYVKARDICKHCRVAFKRGETFAVASDGSIVHSSCYVGYEKDLKFKVK